MFFIKKLFFLIVLLGGLFSSCGRGNIKDAANLAVDTVYIAGVPRYLSLNDTVTEFKGVAALDGDIIIPVEYLSVDMSYAFDSLNVFAIVMKENVGVYSLADGSAIIDEEYATIRPYGFVSPKYDKYIAEDDRYVTVNDTVAGFIVVKMQQRGYEYELPGDRKIIDDGSDELSGFFSLEGKEILPCMFGYIMYRGDGLYEVKSPRDDKGNQKTGLWRTGEEVVSMAGGNIDVSDDHVMALRTSFVDDECLCMAYVLSGEDKGLSAEVYKGKRKGSLNINMSGNAIKKRVNGKVQGQNMRVDVLLAVNGTPVVDASAYGYAKIDCDGPLLDMYISSNGYGSSALFTWGGKEVHSVESGFYEYLGFGLYKVVDNIKKKTGVVNHRGEEVVPIMFDKWSKVRIEGDKIKVGNNRYFDIFSKASVEKEEAPAVDMTDRAILDVTGPVKSVTYIDEYASETWLFDESGRLVQKGNTKLTSSNTERDANGRLLSFFVEEMDDVGCPVRFTTYYKYDRNGVLKLTGYDSEYACWSEDYTRDSQGRITGHVVKDGIEPNTFTYKYSGYDNKDNWTKVVMTDSYNNVTTKSRKILYY